MEKNQPHSHALRRGRVSLPRQAYLITTCTHQRLPLLNSWSPARCVVREMQSLENDGWVSSLSYVIMPDHLHWLFMLDQAQLDAVVKRLKGRSARAINAYLNRRGSVWQQGYHDRALRREEDVRSIARYIVANPLRAGLVNDIGKYPLWDAMWL
ncbi:REP-associated tyrosine transposase [Franzmannia qiaohouensis]|uniref:Transposase n=1 Tax=Franzmannia qiaohouensis TaxID=1329370 RepID=A0ABU1HIV6_9GAMM|nr:transposase [Halomonas qiaohouensis]MDR5907408.1 transposase [Halomonas qiaohouensis]